MVLSYSSICRNKYFILLRMIKELSYTQNLYENGGVCIHSKPIVILTFLFPIVINVHSHFFFDFLFISKNQRPPSPTSSCRICCCCFFIVVGISILCSYYLMMRSNNYRCVLYNHYREKKKEDLLPYIFPL